MATQKDSSRSVQSKAPTISEEHEEAYDAAIDLAEEEQFREAADRIRPVAKAYPTFAEAWHNLGRYCLKSGQKDEALQALEHAEKCYRERLEKGITHVHYYEVETGPAWHYFFLSGVLAMLGRKKDAFDALKQAFEHDVSKMDDFFSDNEEFIEAYGLEPKTWELLGRPIEAKALKKLLPHERPAWTPIVREGEIEGIGSSYSGRAYLCEGEEWPRCCHCDKPMQLMLQLMTAQLPEKMQAELGLKEGAIQLFYCTSSKPPCEQECKAWEPFSESVLVRWVPEDREAELRAAPTKKGVYPAKSIVGWKEQRDFPCGETRSARAFKISKSDEEALEQLEEALDEGGSELTVSGDKLGGWPAWVQSVQLPKCKRCGAKMRFVYQIESEKHLEHRFGDLGAGYLVQCPEHPEELAFFWQCT